VKRELVPGNPVSKIEPKATRPFETQVIEPGQLPRLLDNAPAELLPSLAISYFAGLSTAEILRLEWNDVNLSRGFIEVRAIKAKSAQRRLVPIESNLMLWLSPYSKCIGKLFPYTKREISLAGFRAIAVSQGRKNRQQRAAQLRELLAGFSQRFGGPCQQAWTLDKQAGLHRLPRAC
jgi:integrase